jgi:hypothetical protein
MFSISTESKKRKRYFFVFDCLFNKVIKLRSRHGSLHQVVSKDLVIDDSRTRRLAVEIGYYEKYRYAQLQNRELKTELIRVRFIYTESRVLIDSIDLVKSYSTNS